MLAPPVILPYRAYGTQNRIYLKGHVLDDRVLYQSFKTDRKRKNIKAMLSRYVSQGIPDIRLVITFMNQEVIIATDETGLYETTMTLSDYIEPGWHTIRYQVIDQILHHQEPLEEEGEVYIDGGKNQFIIVSDVDDTVLISHATKLLKRLRLILTKNAKTRLPFMGVAALYQALHRGNPPHNTNPIFYVSNSEWNLYDFLEDFCDVQNIPKGPFMLQEMKRDIISALSINSNGYGHKKRKILQLMDVFPDQPFILIGDSGQHDIQLYLEIAGEQPGRVKTIYIRDIGLTKPSILQTSSQPDLVLVNDSYEAARHAYDKGYIDKKGLQDVKKEFV